MGSFIFISLGAVIGIAIGTLDLSAKDWQIWVIIGCMIVSYICGGI